MTNNFDRLIGGGAFGKVYHGYLSDGTQVAVKLCSDPSQDKQFLAEAQNMTMIHHKNVVPFFGYCKDGNYLALVYEYMPQGNILDHLRGRATNARALSWGERLQIAIGAAEGLEYLHKGCQPPIVHRDVKTSNILLSESLDAKISDFGLSKAFSSGNSSVLSTETVAGTPGYLDPSYHETCELTEKSDVYSFGVVLLELITGRPPIIRGKGHIHRKVKLGLANGDICDVVDAKLQGNYDANSVWKVAEMALRCTEGMPTQRPTMTDVVTQLRE